MNPVRSFADQFTPVEGGYLYYPSRKRGGRRVTSDEFQHLVLQWRRRVGPWKLALPCLVAVIVWTVLSDQFALPDWSGSAFSGLIVVTMAAWVLWAGYAPRRLVKQRPEVAPPRPPKEERRKARAALDWKLVLLVAVASGGFFAKGLLAARVTFSSLALTVGSGLLFFGYLWIAVLKFRDERR